MSSVFNKFSTNQIVRFVALVLAYASILFASLMLSLLLRFDFSVPEPFWVGFGNWSLGIILLKLIILGVAGQYRSLLTFFSFPDAKRLFIALGIAALVEAAVWLLLRGQGMPPRGVIAVDFILSFVGLVSLRMGMRILRESYTGNAEAQLPKSRKRVAILGAGSAGAILAREIQTKPGLGLEVICFIDDDPHKIGKSMHGRQVVGSRRELAEIVLRLSIDKCIIAMPDANPALIKETVAILRGCGIDHDILPSMDQLLHRKVTVSHLRHVSPEDLLGREPVVLDNTAISGLIKNKVVMVTGAGGSIGSELCRQIAAFDPAKIILLERSEPALFAIEQELVKEFKWLTIEPVAASVCNKARINAVFKKFGPQVVFHAAAHKHVPLMERQPAEAISNNSIGTLIVSQAASAYGCEKFILVSTDKAVNPTNVMGASKRVAELVVNSMQKRTETIFASVRFGNVLGSSGSVIPTFRQQIANGGPVTVTHPEVYRFFMSIPEAVGLILQSGAQSQGGEVFVLDMGEPIKIHDIARQMIELCGFVPDEDIKIEFTGLRPGEKLYEEPIHQAENVHPTNHPKLRRLVGSGDFEDINSELETLREHLADMTDGEVKAWLIAKVPEYRPNSNSITQT
jgi:FlaA1/EpsC-like NDP-sugar epimerase